MALISQSFAKHVHANMHARRCAIASKAGQGSQVMDTWQGRKTGTGYLRLMSKSTKSIRPWQRRTLVPQIGRFLITQAWCVCIAELRLRERGKYEVLRLTTQGRALLDESGGSILSLTCDMPFSEFGSAWRKLITFTNCQSFYLGLLAAKATRRRAFGLDFQAAISGTEARRVYKKPIA